MRIKQKEKHQYEYDRNVITFVIRCEDLIFFDSMDLLESAISFVQRIYRETRPRYVFGMHNERIELIGEDHLDYGLPSPISDDGLARNRIDYPTWLMLFPPAMVEEYGREWLLELPAARIDELDDGAILIVATEDIPECESDTEIAQLVGDAMEPIEAAFANHT